MGLGLNEPVLNTLQEGKNIMKAAKVVPFSLRDFYYIVFYRKAAIVVVFTSTLFTVITGVYLWPETYEASSKIMVKVGRENSSFPTIASSSGQVITSLGVTKEEVNTEIEILGSQLIAEKIVRKIGLDLLFMSQAEKPKNIFKRIKYEVKKVYNKIKDQVNEFLYYIDLKKKLSPEQNAILAIRAGLSAKPVRSSNVIDIRFSWFNPDLAKLILNTLTDFFIKHHLETHKTSGGYQFIQNQVELLEKRLKESEERLHWLKEKEGIISFNDQNKFLLKKFTDFNATLKNTKTELAETVSEINELEKHHTVYTEIQKKLILKKVRLKALTEKEKQLEGHTTAYKDDLKRLNSFDLEIKRLKRQAEIDDHNYLLYRKKLEEARISNVLDSKQFVNVRVIDPSYASYNPVRPRKMLIIGLGFALSLIVGIGYAFFLEYLDHSIKREEDVERHLELPILASIREI